MGFSPMIPAISGGGSTLNFLTISNSDATDGLYNSINQEPTINVATLLPSVYMNLTLDNFSLIDVSPFNGTTTPSGGQTSLFGSYNPTTGILQMNKVYARQTVGSSTIYRYLKYKIRVAYTT